MERKLRLRAASQAVKNAIKREQRKYLTKIETHQQPKAVLKLPQSDPSLQNSP